MKIKSVSYLVGLMAVTITGCSTIPQVPACDSSETLEVVQQIFKKQTVNRLQYLANYFNYNVSNIRTTGTDPTTGAHTCAASLHLQSSQLGSQEFYVTYTVENTSDGSFYVMMYGY